MTNKSFTSAMTGMAVGAIVGTAAYMMSDKRSGVPQMKRMKRSADRAIRNAGIIIDSMSNMMR